MVVLHYIASLRFQAQAIPTFHVSRHDGGIFKTFVSSVLDEVAFIVSSLAITPPFDRYCEIYYRRMTLEYQRWWEQCWKLIVKLVLLHVLLSKALNSLHSRKSLLLPKPRICWRLSSLANVIIIRSRVHGSAWKKQVFFWSMLRGCSKPRAVASHSNSCPLYHQHLS